MPHVLQLKSGRAFLEEQPSDVPAMARPAAAICPEVEHKPTLRSHRRCVAFAALAYISRTRGRRLLLTPSSSHARDDWKRLKPETPRELRRSRLPPILSARRTSPFKRIASDPDYSFH